MKKCKSLTNFYKIKKITNILYDELLKNNKFSKLNKLLYISSILYNEIFDEKNITTFSKFKKIINILSKKVNGKNNKSKRQNLGYNVFWKVLNSNNFS